VREPGQDEARRIAVWAQLLDGRARDLPSTIDRLGFLQLDPIAVVAPTQHLVLWNRLGAAYDPVDLDSLLAERRLYEWNAFLWPADALPLIRALMRSRSSRYAFERRAAAFLEANASFRRYILGELERRGPLRSRELEDRSAGARERHRWYGSRGVAIMLDILHRRGQVAIVGRRSGERLWDLAERWYPPADPVPLRQARRELLDRQRRALGVWLEQGRWQVHAEATDGPVPDRVALPSPFDRLIHDRERAEALFGFRYRIEIYLPKERREFGYYVLPVLFASRLIGRIDPAFDREAGILRVNAVHAEADAPVGVWPAVREQIDALGAWLGAGEVVCRACPGPGASGRAPASARFYNRGIDFETRAIHEGQEPDPTTGSVTVPIYQTSTFVQEAVGVHRGYDYARVANPTRTALQVCLASLEGAEHGIAFSSGLGAATTIMHLVNPGERVVCVNDVYGGVYRLFSQVYEPKGYSFEYLSAAEFGDGLVEHLDERTRLVWLETPTNPLLNLVDVRAAAEAAHAAGALVVVDNTFATPYLQQPLSLGADLAVHSTTKYLGGHSDLVGGFAATNDPTIAERLLFLQKSLGAVPGPFDCWLVLRGLKTLAVRMRQHCENARAVANFLAAHPAVERVLYPGLPHHPGHELAARQMRDFGGMVSFLVGSEEEAVELVARTNLWLLAESLGGVESLIEHPARMTHASTADAPFAAPRNLVRLSVGIESADDLVADLAAALVRSEAASA
jgi:cystathionine beta-lyase/cystathionine gamma-synthase/uncharacterized protein YcaQ